MFIFWTKCCSFWFVAFLPHPLLQMCDMGRTVLISMYILNKELHICLRGLWEERLIPHEPLGLVFGDDLSQMRAWTLLEWGDSQLWQCMKFIFRTIKCTFHWTEPWGRGQWETEWTLQQGRGRGCGKKAGLKKKTATGSGELCPIKQSMPKDARVNGVMTQMSYKHKTVVTRHKSLETVLMTGESSCSFTYTLTSVQFFE
jgi:hypothetical protein